MSETELDAYCGLYCGACDIYQLSEKARLSGTPAKWAEMPERLRKRIKQAAIACGGCKSDTLFSGCRKCPIVRCAKKRGVASCALCSRYPCFRFKAMNAVVRLTRLDRQLPHLAVRAPNLEYIGRQGRAAFLAEQRRAWNCPRCAAPASWYMTRCPACGQDVARYS